MNNSFRHSAAALGLALAVCAAAPAQALTLGLLGLLAGAVRRQRAAGAHST